ncbi:MAG: hypothetical protein KDC54_12520 [Lewinella sp.]|nr:hypothetical protein [Lewinella sp.]
MDPVSAVAGAVSNIVSVVGFGRRSEYANQPGWLTPDDFKGQDYIIPLLIGGGVFILIIIIIAITFTKK